MFFSHAYAYTHTDCLLYSIFIFYHVSTLRIWTSRYFYSHVGICFSFLGCHLLPAKRDSWGGTWRIDFLSLFHQIRYMASSQTIIKQYIFYFDNGLLKMNYLGKKCIFVKICNFLLKESRCVNVLSKFTTKLSYVNLC